MDAVEQLDTEIAQLEEAIAEPGLPAADQVRLRERHAFVAAKKADLERSAPYASTDTGDLQAQREAGELEREDVRLALDAAILNRGGQSVLARKLTADLEAITLREAGLRAELSTRAMQEANAELGRRRAAVVAERELRAEDQAALAELDDWRKSKAAEALSDSFPDRLAARTPTTEERLWAEAEKRVGASLLFPGSTEPAADPVKEQQAQEALEARLADFERAQQA